MFHIVNERCQCESEQRQGIRAQPKRIPPRQHHHIDEFVDGNDHMVSVLSVMKNK